MSRARRRTFVLQVPDHKEDAVSCERLQALRSNHSVVLSSGWTLLYKHMLLIKLNTKVLDKIDPHKNSIVFFVLGF